MSDIEKVKKEINDICDTHRESQQSYKNKLLDEYKTVPHISKQTLADSIAVQVTVCIEIGNLIDDIKKVICST